MEQPWPVPFEHDDLWSSHVMRQHLLSDLLRIGFRAVAKRVSIADIYKARKICVDWRNLVMDAIEIRN